MTDTEAIEILRQRSCCRECVADCTCKECDEAFEMGISAIEKLSEIKSIINSPLPIQEDIFRYKAICEALEKGDDRK